MAQRAWPLLLVVLFCGCRRSPTSASPATAISTQLPSEPPVRVLMLTATAAFRHESIPAARSAVASLAAQSGAFTVTATEDLRELTAARLASTDVVMFALTTGELPFDADQKTAIAGFVAAGGGFIGIHSAA